MLSVRSERPTFSSLHTNFGIKMRQIRGIIEDEESCCCNTLPLYRYWGVSTPSLMSKRSKFLVLFTYSLHTSSIKTHVGQHYLPVHHATAAKSSHCELAKERFEATIQEKVNLDITQEEWCNLSTELWAVWWREPILHFCFAKLIRLFKTN